jgi:hypothetical protein
MCVIGTPGGVNPPQEHTIDAWTIFTCASMVGWIPQYAINLVFAPHTHDSFVHKLHIGR